MSKINKTLSPPYYAVIFTNIRNEGDHGYGSMSEKMVQLAQQEEGFLGLDSVRQGIGITVSYWRDTESILKWKKNTEHLVAQKLGKEQWYKEFNIRIAKVEREYAFPGGKTPNPQ